jgi:hypothetical protein
MKTLLTAAFVALSVASFTTEAKAVVCAKGVVRAGCVGPNGAVVSRRPVVRHRVVRPPVTVIRPAPVRRCSIVRGVRVCR